MADDAIKALLVAADEIALELISKFKDGVQFSDFVSFYEDFQNNADFKAKIEAAWNNYKAIPDEIKNLNVSEAIDLVLTEVAYVPKFLAAIKG